MHDCLRQNLDKLSEGCRKEEISLSVLQASNTELMPNIANACKVRASDLHLYFVHILRSNEVLTCYAGRMDWYKRCAVHITAVQLLGAVDRRSVHAEQPQILLNTC